MDIKISFDEEMQELTDKVFSSLLCGGKDAKVILRNLKKALTLDDMYGIHRIMYTKFLNQESISLVKEGYMPKLTRTALETSMGTRIDEYVQDYKLDVPRVMTENGKEEDLSIRTNYEVACGLIYDLTMEKYDYLVDLAVTPDEGISYLQDLKHAVLSNLYAQSVNIQSRIMNEGVWMDERGRGVMFRGLDGISKFSNKFPLWIESRFSGYLSNKVDEYDFDSVESNKNFRRDFKETVYQLFNYGYEPLDEVISVNTSDVITVVGDEGVGKTNFVVDLAVKSMLAGHDVLFMTGESSIPKIRYMVLARLMYDFYGKTMSWKEVMEYSDLPESVQLEIDDLDIKTAEDPTLGKLRVVKKFKYETFYQTIKEKCEEFPNIKTVVIDHIGRLDSTGEHTCKGYLNNDKDRVDFLYEQCIDVSDDYPLAIVLLAHSSSNANQDSNREKNAGVRVGAISSATTKDADVVFYLRKNDMLNKQGMLTLDVVKVREARSNIRPLILKRNEVGSMFEYQKENQIIKEDDFNEDSLYM